MHRLLLPLLLLMAAPAHAGIDNMVWLHESVVAQVCEMMEVECDSVEPPLLVVLDIGKRLNALGLYMIGTNVVMVSSECNGRLADREMCDAILMHEVAHYISYTLNPEIAKCESESIAWKVYNDYVKSLGRYRTLGRPNWKLEYPQCVKSLNSSTSLVTR